MTKSKFITLEEVKKAATDYLLLEDEKLVEIPLAVFVANKLSADPLWMFITGPPSNAKTEILRAMNDHEQTKVISSLTTNTLLSGSKGKDASGNDFDPSLLLRISGKLLIIKDFTTILTLRDDSKSQILSQLREVYDGQYAKAYGTGQIRSWKGKIGLLAAVTPVIDKHMSVSQLLGERFLHYRTSSGSQYAVAKRAVSNILQADAHRKRFHDAMTGYMAELGKIDQVNLIPNNDIEDRIATLAVFCATARTGIMRNRYDKTLEIMPVPEGAGRIAQQLWILATALAIVRGLETIDENIYQVVKKVARDSMPSLRLGVLEAAWNLYQEEPEWYTTKEIAAKAGVPTTTCKEKLENLHVLKLLDRSQKGDGETSPYIWVPTDFLISLQRVSNVLT